MCKMKKIPEKIVKKCRECDYFTFGGGNGRDISAWCGNPDAAMNPEVFLEDYDKMGEFPDWCPLQTVWPIPDMSL